MNVFSKKICFILVLLMIPLLMAGQARLTTSRTVAVKQMVVVKLESWAKHYRGVCPVKVTMTGKVTVPSAMTVKYRFQRSDGVSGRLTPLSFPSAGTKNIPFAWTIGKNYNGWVQLVVLAGGKEYRSVQFYFDVICDEQAVMASVPKLTKIEPTADLIILNITRVPHDVYHGKVITFLITIKNISTMAGKMSPPCHLGTKFKMWGNPKVYFEKTHPIPGIASGMTFTFKMKQSLFKPGSSWRLFAHADVNDEVKEIKEFNNKETNGFIVRSN